MRHYRGGEDVLRPAFAGPKIYGTAWFTAFGACPAMTWKGAMRSSWGAPLGWKAVKRKVRWTFRRPNTKPTGLGLAKCV